MDGQVTGWKYGIDGDLNERSGGWWIGCGSTGCNIGVLKNEWMGKEMDGCKNINLK